MKVTCPICYKQLSKITNSHLKTHNITYSEFRIEYPNTLIESASVKLKNIIGCQNRNYDKLKQARIHIKEQEYLKNPRLCKYCSKILKYGKHLQVFCNSSCSAKYNNITRKHSENTKQQISRTLKLKYKQIQYSTARIEAVKNNIPYSKLYYNKCRHCDALTILNTKQKYCKQCANNYSDGLRYIYSFRFNVYEYPNLFDLNYINTVGWFSNGGKYGTKQLNKSGLSKDHKISVHDAIINAYDPYYITHPLNCDIIPQLDNMKKHTTSSISYNELIIQVNEYNLKYGVVDKG